MRSAKIGVLAFGLLLSACGGGEEAAKPAEAPPPPSVSVSSATTAQPADTTAKAPEAPKPSMADMQTSAMKSVFEGFNAHDAKKILANDTDDVVQIVPGMPDVRGKDAATATLQMMWTAFPDAKYAMSRMWQKNDVAIVEYGFTGTNTGDFMGMKATNKPVGVMGLVIAWYTPEGLMKEMHRYTDMGSVMAQLGVPKAKGRPMASLPTSSESHMAKGTPDEDKNVDAVKQMNGTMEKKDMAGFLGMVNDDSTYDDMTMPGQFHGKKDAEKFFTTFTKAFPDLKENVTNAWGVEDYVITEGTMTGTQKGALSGPMGTIPATNKSVNLHRAEIMQIKDGKMTHGWSYGNGAEFAMQLGLMKPPGDAKAAPKGDAKAAAPAPAAAPKK